MPDSASPIAAENKNTRILVSLIVPVYNNEKTLPALFTCIDAQTLESFEVIFIDDGSTDSSLELLHNYATSRQDTIVLRQEYSGVGAARNAGLRIARGDYIAFSDADAAIAPDFLRAPFLRALATGSDFVIFDFDLKSAPDQRVTVRPSQDFRAAVQLKKAVSWRDVSDDALNITIPSVVNKLWKRSFIESRNLTFFSFFVAEDWAFATKAILAAKRISYLPMTIYTYDISLRTNVTNVFTGRQLLTNIEAWEHVVSTVSSDEEYLSLCSRVAWTLLQNQLWYNAKYQGDWSDAESHEYIIRFHKLLNNRYFCEVTEGDFSEATLRNLFVKMKDSEPEDIIKALADAGNFDRFLDNSPSSAENVCVSLVVPVYNAESFLPEFFRCLDNQTFADFEVVFVDDGSSDSSLYLLEDYVSQHDNAVVISQENRGAGAARNVGLERARGDYIAFIDVDDAVTATYLHDVYSKAIRENADIVIHGHVDVVDGVATTYYPRVCDLPEFAEQSVMSWRDDPERILASTGMHATWTRMYRRSFLLEKGIRYPEIAAANDWPFSVLAVLHAERIAWLREAPYTYIRRLDNDSITAKKKTGYKLVALDACDFALREAQKLPYYELIRSSLWLFVAQAIWTAVAFYDWEATANEEMKEFLARVPIMCRHFGVSDKDMEVVKSADTAAGVMLKALLEQSVQEIESVLETPFVLALHAEKLEDAVPVVETEAARRGRQNFQFSAIHVYLPSSESADNSCDVLTLEYLIESGWLHIHHLSEGIDSEWFLEALKDNPQAHLLLGSIDRTARSWLSIGLFTVGMLEHPGAVIAGGTRTVRLKDSSTISVQHWAETATVVDKASANLWVDTSRYYLIPHGVLDIAKAEAVFSCVPQSVRDDEEYALNTVLQACGIFVASARSQLFAIGELGGSTCIKDIDSDVLQWIEDNRAFAVDDSAQEGYGRLQYLELLAEQLKNQQERNRHQLHGERTRAQILEDEIAQYRTSQYRVDAVTIGIVDIETSRSEFLESAIASVEAEVVRLQEEIFAARRHVRQLESELEKVRSAADVWSQTDSEGLPFFAGEKDLEWSEPKSLLVEIPAVEQDFHYRPVFYVKPGEAYRVTLTMVDGNASGFEVRLWDSKKRIDSHRRWVEKGKSVGLSFAVLPEAENANLLVYPEGIGKTAGFSATIRAEIQSASFVSTENV